MRMKKSGSMNETLLWIIIIVVFFLIVMAFASHGFNMTMGISLFG